MSSSHMVARPQLLVSVRSTGECTAALQPGVDLIDVKEPDLGSLGNARLETLTAVIQAVDGRVPVSAALGELRDVCLSHLADLPPQLKYVKFGLSGYASSVKWQRDLREAQRFLPQGVALVAVAYADSSIAAAPDWRDVLSFAVSQGIGVLLVDTFDKTAGRLLDWLSPVAIGELIAAAHQQGVQVALAGSLAVGDMPIVCRCLPDIIAVRSAVTEGGRSHPVSAAAVRRLALRISVETSKQVG